LWFLLYKKYITSPFLSGPSTPRLRGVHSRVERVEVPTAVAIFPKNIFRPPKEWAEPAYDVRRFMEMAWGGHFAALEEPELLVEDIRAFFRPLR
jgi:pimeloyl-ACP methyl ester carboxylesterase